jgi:hypothetical protein
MRDEVLVAAHWLRGTALVLAAALAGCGGQAKSGFIVTGRIVRGGAPLQVRGSESGAGRVEVRLVPQFEGAGVETAIAAEDGAFRILAGGDGVPAGKYKIVILALEPAPRDQPTETGEVDALNGAYSLEHTPLGREIGRDSHDLGTIDLANPGG